jgi:hypothetical protein
MINEFSVHAKPKNKNSAIAFVVLLLTSALGFCVYFIIDSYKGVVGLFALMILTVAILVYTKFIAPAFYYDIAIDSEGIPMFVVRQIIGKRQTTLCRLDLADIVSVDYETKKERSLHKTPRGTRKYIYAPTMFPKEIYRITAKGHYESAEIIIEGSEVFANTLRDYSIQARKMRIDSEE